MITYSQHQPTAFDSCGAFLADRQKWLVAPVFQTRDSGALEQSNFAVLLASVGGESDIVEVHRFGHWGPGWYELILIAPESPAAIIADECEAKLLDYPILSESDFSVREWERASECWASMRIRERVELCRRYRCSIFAARRDYLPPEDNGLIYQYCAE